MAQAQLSDVTQPGDPIVGSSNNNPGSEGVANAIDNTQAKYLNFDILNTGFTVTPSVGATLVTGLTLTSANDAPERDPSSYVLSGSNDGTNWTVIDAEDVPLFSGRYVEQDFSFTNTTKYTQYRLIFPTVVNAPNTANSMQISEVQFLGVVIPPDVTQPGDPIVGSSNNNPGSEGVANAIDNTPAKYLNFDILNTGFTVTPSVGATIITGIGLTSANDAPERDPSTYVVSGSIDGTNFTQIAAGNVPLFSGRYVEQDFVFSNTTPYKVYKIIFPTVVNAPNTANSMQISEVQFFGNVAPQDVTQPGDPIVATSNNSPGSEGVANAIDNTPAKYLNFDIVNTGFTVTPSVGATIVTGLALTSANDAPERDPSSYVIAGSTDGTTFTQISAGSVPLFSGRYVEQDFYFDNTVKYTSYKVIFPTVVNGPNTANSMQISEVQLLGFAANSSALPQFKTEPVDAPTLVGASANFYVVVNGPWGIQWYSNNVAIAGATQLTYTTPPTTSANNGDVYYAVAKNGGLTSQSDNAHVVQFTPSANKSISLNFIGGGANGAPTSLDPSDIAGVWKQAYWNNETNATDFSVAVVDSDNNSSAITVSYSSSGFWGSGTGTANPDTRMLNGMMEGNASGDVVTFENVPAGNYSIIAYSVGRPAEFENSDLAVVGATSSPTNYIRIQNSDEYKASPGYVRGSSTNSAVRDVANYIRFDNVSPDANGQINLFVVPEMVNVARAVLNGVQLLINPPAVGTPPQITTQPLSENLTPSSTAVLSVVVSGTPTITYQWRKNGSNLSDGGNISGSKTAQLTLTGLAATDAGIYTVFVQNGAGSLSSSPAVLTLFNGSITDRLVAHWTFDDGAGMVASNSVASGQPGALQGYTDNSAWGAGQIGGSLSFDGQSQWVSVSDFAKPDTALTVSAWVNADTFSNGDSSEPTIIANPGVVTSDGRSLSPFELGLNATDGDLTSLVASGPNNHVIREGTPNPLVLSTWHHVLLIADGAQVALYRDGIKLGVADYSGNIEAAAAACLGIGGYQDVTNCGSLNPTRNGLWVGKLDDIGIWTRALGADEITAIYNAGLAHKDLSTVSTAPLNVSLSVSLSGANLTISWPASATGYTLESKTSLSSGTWTAVTGVVNNSVTVSTATGSKFFRLRK